MKIVLFKGDDVHPDVGSAIRMGADAVSFLYLLQTENFKYKNTTFYKYLIWMNWKQDAIICLVDCI